MTEQGLVTVAGRWHQDIYFRGRLDAADEICAADLVAHGTGVAPDAPRGPAFVRADAAALRASFDIESLTDDDVIVSGDQVVIRWTLRARHVGAFLGAAGTGRRVSVTGIDIFRLEGGRIAEFWGEFDLLGLARQVGALTADSATVQPAQPGQILTTTTRSFE
jgi:ketosteroid isomerase-like protein